MFHVSFEKSQFRNRSINYIGERKLDLGGEMDEKHIIVTGASRGLGLVTARLLLARGASVTCFSRDLTGKLEEMISKSNGKARHVTFDLSQHHKFSEIVRQVDQHSPIYGLINNAALSLNGSFLVFSTKKLELLAQTNLIGTFVLTREVCKRMLVHGGGAIVNVTSISTHTAFSGISGYSSTKAAIEAWTRAAAHELGSSSIRVNAVSPGFIENETGDSLSDKVREKIIQRTPLGRFVKPEEVAEAIVFLISDGSQGITGATIPVDGGCSL